MTKRGQTVRFLSLAQVSDEQEVSLQQPVNEHRAQHGHVLRDVNLDCHLAQENPRKEVYKGNPLESVG